jgi:hypothetical protein
LVYLSYGSGGALVFPWPNTGFNLFGTDNGLVGSVDDVRIYNIALSPSQVQQLYNGTLSYHQVSQPSTEIAAVGAGTVNYY